MKFDNLYPSKYIKASDVTTPITVTITGSSQEEVGQDDEKSIKPVLHFLNQKSLVLNKTNGLLVCELYGDETDEWNGKQITLYSARVPFGGKMVDSVRVRAPMAAAAPVVTLTGDTVWSGKIIQEVKELEMTKDGQKVKGWVLELKTGEKVGTYSAENAELAKSVSTKESGVERSVDMTVGPGAKPGSVILINIEDTSDVPF